MLANLTKFRACKPARSGVTVGGGTKLRETDYDNLVGTIRNKKTFRYASR